MIIEFDKPSLSICPSIFTNNIINKLKYNFAMGQLELKFLIQGVAVILGKLLQTLNINDSTFSQSLYIEFDKDGLEEAYEHATVLIDNLVEQVKPILLPILLIGAAILFIKLGFLVSLGALGAAFLSRLGSAIYIIISYIAAT